MYKLLKRKKKERICIAHTQCFYKLYLNLAHMYLNTYSELLTRHTDRQINC